MIIFGDVCFAEVVNSIVARVNSRTREHIITLIDLNVEYEIQKKIMGDNVTPKNELLEEMIDFYLVSLELKKTRRNKVNKDIEKKIESGIKMFESLFDEGGYKRFLSEHDITGEDIALRFRERALIEEFLSQKRRGKKKGSNLKKNMILKKDALESQKHVREYLDNLRSKCSLLMVNDIY